MSQWALVHEPMPFGPLNRGDHSLAVACLSVAERKPNSIAVDRALAPSATASALRSVSFASLRMHPVVRLTS